MAWAARRSSLNNKKGGRTEKIRRCVRARAPSWAGAPPRAKKLTFGERVDFHQKLTFGRLGALCAALREVLGVNLGTTTLQKCEAVPRRARI